VASRDSGRVSAYDDIEHSDNSGDSPLMIAAGFNNSCVELLLSKRAQLEHANDQGETAPVHAMFIGTCRVSAGGLSIECYIDQLETLD
jgi:hypothetical protein